MTVERAQIYIEAQLDLAGKLSDLFHQDVLELDERDGKSDGVISLEALANHEEFKGRIVRGPAGGRCLDAYLVDDGDGKISDNDLFLHADGYFSVKVEGKDRLTFRHKNLAPLKGVIILASSEVDPSVVKHNPNLFLQSVYNVWDSIRDYMGKPFSVALFSETRMKKICESPMFRK